MINMYYVNVTFRSLKQPLSAVSLPSTNYNSQTQCKLCMSFLVYSIILEGQKQHDESEEAGKNWGHDDGDSFAAQCQGEGDVTPFSHES